MTGTRDGTRTRMPLQAADFKSAVYTIPPLWHFVFTGPACWIRTHILEVEALCFVHYSIARMLNLELSWEC